MTVAELTRRADVVVGGVLQDAYIPCSAHVMASGPEPGLYNAPVGNAFSD